MAKPDFRFLFCSIMMVFYYLVITHTKHISIFLNVPLKPGGYWNSSLLIREANRWATKRAILSARWVCRSLETAHECHKHTIRHIYDDSRRVCQIQVPHCLDKAKKHWTRAARVGGWEGRRNEGGFGMGRIPVGGPDMGWDQPPALRLDTNLLPWQISIRSGCLDLRQQNHWHRPK